MKPRRIQASAKVKATPYTSVKAKALGTLHERMRLVMQLADGIDFEDMPEFQKALTDLEDEVSRYVAVDPPLANRPTALSELAAASTRDDWEEFVESGEELIRVIDEDLSEDATDRAGTFFEDVKEKVTSMLATIRKTQSITDKQKSALSSWDTSVRKWIH